MNLALTLSGGILIIPPVNATRCSDGAIAQLGERLHGMQEVSGSIPLSSTKPLSHQVWSVTPESRGAIAQLGERLHGMQEVSGSIPLSSTKIKTLALWRGFLLSGCREIDCRRAISILCFICHARAFPCQPGERFL